MDSEKRKAAQARYRASPEGIATRRRGEAAALKRHQERLTVAKAGGCVDCGAQDVELHFHHIDPSTKTFHVACMVGRSTALFEAEIAKCEVVCEPCHWKRHPTLPRR